MNIAKPCSYHYLFTHIPDYDPHDASDAAQEIASPLIETLQLHQKEVLEKSHPLVTPLRFCFNKDTKTYLVQFHFYDVLVTILVLNRTDEQQDSITYWKDTLISHFPERTDTFGQTSILFAQAEPDSGILPEIGNGCFGVTIREHDVSCRFEWGTLYALPQCYTSLERNGQHAYYFLLIAEEEQLSKGDQLLSYSFPMLELFRQKLVFEEQQARLIKNGQEKHRTAITKLHQEIERELNKKTPALTRLQDKLLQADGLQVRVYQYIAATGKLIQTLKSNATNLEFYLTVLPIQKDKLFKSLPRRFRSLAQEISGEVEHAAKDAYQWKEEWNSLWRRLYVLTQKPEPPRSEPPPARMWEHEIENLQKYYHRIQNALSQPETPDKMAGELGYLLRELEMLFRNQEALWVFVSARRIVELIIETMHRRHFPQLREWLSLSTMIKRCYEKEHLFPEYIFFSFHHVRELGNFGAHPIPSFLELFAKRQAKEILSALATIMEWYREENKF